MATTTKTTKPTARKRAAAPPRAKNPKGKTNTADMFSILNQLSRSLSLTRGNLDETLNALMGVLVNEMGIDAIAIWVVDEHAKFMQIKDSVGLSERYVRFFNKTDKIPVGGGLVGRVLEERRTIHFDSLAKYMRLGIVRWNKMLEEEGVTSVMSSPMFVGEHIVGAFNVYYKKVHYFDSDERLFVEIIANQLAVILENNKSYDTIDEGQKRLKDQIDKLFNIQKVIQNIDLHVHESVGVSSKYIADYAAYRFGASGISVFQAREEQLEGIELMAAHGISDKHISYIKEHIGLVRTETLIGLAMSEKTHKTSSRVFTDERIKKHWRTLMSIEGKTAMGVFPLMVREKVEGVLVVYYKEPHVFAPEEIGIFGTFSQFLGTSLKNIFNFQSLLAEKEKIGAIIHSIYDGLIVYNLKGNIIEVNRRAEEMLWLRKDLLVGKNPNEFVEYKGSDPLKNIYDISRMEISNFEYKEIEISSPMNIMLRVSKVPLSDETKEIGHMIILNDITEIKRVEQLKVSFVSIASHQIRTPLTGVGWGLRFLLENVDREDMDKAEQKKLIEKILVGYQNIIKIVNDLLDTSRIEEKRFGYKFEETEITPIVEKITKELELNLKNKNITLTTRLPEEALPRVSVDMGKIDMAIRNIIENAIKYTAAGGTVDVLLGVKEEFLGVTVKDNGIGVPEEDRKFLFTKFFRGKNAIRMAPDGSGLGLFIAKNIVQHHNGNMIFESELDKGSSFSVLLPIREEKMPHGTVEGL